MDYRHQLQGEDYEHMKKKTPNVEKELGTSEICCSATKEVRRTLEKEGFVPVGVEVLPLHLGLQLVLFVGQQVDFDKGVRGSGEILGGELLAPEHLDGEGGVLEAVAYAELDPAQLLADGPFAVVVLRTWRQLRGDKRSREHWRTREYAHDGGRRWGGITLKAHLKRS